MEGAFLSPKLLFQTFFQPRAREPAPPTPQVPHRGLHPGDGDQAALGVEGAGAGPAPSPRASPTPRGSRPLAGSAARTCEEWRVGSRCR